MNKTPIILTLMLAMLLGSACHRRPLIDPAGAARVNVIVRTDGIQNVSCDIYNEELPVQQIDPEMIRVVLYDREDDRVVAEKYISDKRVNEDGFTVMSGNMIIPPGVYGMLCYNFDTQATIIRNPNSWNSIEAYTERVSARVANSLPRLVKGDGDEILVLNEPDYLMVGRMDEHKVPFHSGVHEITMEAFPTICTYYLQIKVKGAQFIASAQAVVTGLGPSKFLSRDEMIWDKPVGTHFNLIKSRDGLDDVLCGTFNTFGKVSDAPSSLYITFDISKPDGSKQVNSYDIGHLFFTEDGIRHHWLFVEDELEVDEPVTGSTGGGFVPGVGDWDEESREIPI